MSQRSAGLRIDGANAALIPRYELESIRAPTLVISLEDDLYDTYPGAQYTAQHVHDARFIGFASGGHIGVGLHEKILHEVGEFLSSAP